MAGRTVLEIPRRHAVRDNLDPISRQPSLADGVREVLPVQQQQAMGALRGLLDLREPRERVPDPARPGLRGQAGAGIVEHAPVIQLLESVRAADERRRRSVDPETFGAGRVDDVVVRARLALCDRARGVYRADQLADLPRSRTADLVAEHDVAAV